MFRAFNTKKTGQVPDETQVMNVPYYNFFLEY